MSASDIQHVFVLMLENRSFDHMLGLSGITGTDAVTGRPAKILGLSGAESNSYAGNVYPVTRSADYVMQVDPAHEFPDVLAQLTGPGAQYFPGGPYPPINNSGFVSSYASAGGEADPAEIMKCFLPTQLPVLNALAQNFVVCDQWFCSLPGPTWPNRFFLLAGSSGGLDHSPTTAEMIAWQTLDGFEFQNGTIFDRGLSWRIYAGGDLCLAHALKGIHFFDITPFSQFAADVANPAYAGQFTLIEPNYGHVFTNYKEGNSQHPLDDVTSGEGLIKAVYEAIRNSPLWPSSMLILTWDEHGGFFDHVAPLAAVAPGDTPQVVGVNQFGFSFEQYGPRVPALVVSPLVPANLIDHRTYDHASVLATLKAIFGVPPLTARDTRANRLDSLVTLSAPRDDAPQTLPTPVAPQATAQTTSAAAIALPGPAATRPADPVGSERSTPGFVYVAMRNDLDLSPPEQHPAIHARVSAIHTRDDARSYVEDVRAKVHSARARPRP